MCSIFVEILGFFMFMVKLLYLFVYVPVAGHIAPASARNRIGPLSMHSTSNGGPGRARGCHWERCGSTFLCITSAIRVEAAGLDRTYPKWDRSQTSVFCRPSDALGVGTQRIKRLEHVLNIC